MNPNESVMKFLNDMDFSDVKTSCQSCKETRQVLCLIPCFHQICYECRNKADNTNDIIVLFLCPLCNEEITDWELINNKYHENDEENNTHENDENNYEHNHENKIIKVLDTKHNKVKKLWTFLFQQQIINQQLIPTEEIINNNGFIFTTLRNLPGNVADETRNILSKYPITDLLQADKECKDAEKVLSFRVPNDIFIQIQNSVFIDSFFIDIKNISFTINGYDCKAVLMTRNGLYMGHGWYYTHVNFPNFCGISGFRTSIVNTLMKSSMKDQCPEYRRNVIRELLLYVENMALNESRTKIICPNMIDNMDYVLSTMNYSEVTTNKNIPERKFYLGLFNRLSFFIKKL